MNFNLAQETASNNTFVNHQLLTSGDVSVGMYKYQDGLKGWLWLSYLTFEKGIVKSEEQAKERIKLELAKAVA